MSEEIKGCPPEITDEMVEAGCEAMAKVHAAMRDRNLSDEPECMDDFDEGDVCRAVFLAMDKVRQANTRAHDGDGGDKTRLLIAESDKPLAFSELDDVALGRFARSYLIECERAFHSYAGDKEMPYSIVASMHGALALVRIAAEANAGTYALTQESVTIAAQPMGDWKITIKQTKAPAPPQSTLEQEKRG